MDEILKGTDLLPYDLSYIPDFNSLIAISQRLSKPVFDLTDEEIDQEGKVFGYAAKTMHENRNNFFNIIESLADRVIRLILWNLYNWYNHNLSKTVINQSLFVI